MEALEASPYIDHKKSAIYYACGYQCVHWNDDSFRQIKRPTFKLILKSLGRIKLYIKLIEPLTYEMV